MANDEFVPLESRNLKDMAEFLDNIRFNQNTTLGEIAMLMFVAHAAGHKEPLIIKVGGGIAGSGASDKRMLLQMEFSVKEAN